MITFLRPKHAKRNILTSYFHTWSHAAFCHEQYHNYDIQLWNKHTYYNLLYRTNNFQTYPHGIVSYSFSVSYIITLSASKLCSTDHWTSNKCGAVGWVKTGRGNESTWRKPIPLPLCPPQIPYGLTWDQTQATMVTSWWPIATAMAQPLVVMSPKYKPYI
jgi:hypothetical protein